MADKQEGNESEFPKPKRVPNIPSDSECRRRLQEREREINLRFVSLRQKYSKLVTPLPSNHGQMDDKGDENKSNALLMKDEESAAPGVGRGRGRGRTWNPQSSTPEPAAPEIAPYEFPPYDPSDYDGGEKSESAGEREEAASLPKGLGRGRGYRRPVTPTPVRSPITDKDLAAPIAASHQFDDDRKFTPPERRTQKREKESDTSSKNEETEVDARPKPGIGRGRGRGKEKPSPTPRSSWP